MKQRNIVRTAGGLRDALFDEIDALRNGSGTPARARAVALLANAALQSVSTEIEVHRYVKELENNGIDAPRIGALSLTNRARVA